MRSPRSLACFAVLFVLTGASPSARAGSPTDPPATTEAAAERARKLHIEGAKLFADGKYDQAYVAFVAAWALKKHPQIAGNLADCEMKLHKYRDAAEHYRFIVRNASGDAQPAEQKQAQERLAEAKGYIASVAVVVNVAGAEVLVDGATVGASPIADVVFLAPGRHTIECSHTGYAPAKETIDVVAGSKPTARVNMIASVPPQITPNTKSAVPVVLGLGVAAAGIGVGIAGLAASGSNQSDVNRLSAGLQPMGSSACSKMPTPPQCDQLDSALVNVGSFRNLGIVGFAVAGAAAVATVTYLLLPSSSASSGPTVTTGLVVAPGRGSLLVGGTF
jgi:hypothetical protein